MDLNEAEKLAVELMETHGLSRWVFRYNTRLQTSFGRCWKSRKTIELNPRLVAVNNEWHVKDTILHEIAHALCRSKKSHGTAWKSIAAKIGAVPKRCYDNNVVDYRKI